MLLLLFPTEWTKSYFVVQTHDKPVCLIYVMCNVFTGSRKVKKSNLTRQFNSCHSKLNHLTGQLRKDKIIALKKGAATCFVSLRMLFTYHTKN